MNKEFTLQFSLNSFNKFTFELTDENLSQLKDMYLFNEPLVVKFKESENISKVVSLALNDLKNTSSYLYYIINEALKDKINNKKDEDLWCELAYNLIKKIIEDKLHPFDDNYAFLAAFSHKMGNFYFKFTIPKELIYKKFSESDADLFLHVPDAGFYVQELGPQIIFEYLIPSYYKELIGLGYDNFKEEDRRLNIFRMGLY